MPKRSTIDLLPEPIRAELDARLAQSAFGDYEGHAEWLDGKGHPVSVSALKRYGVRRKTSFESDASFVQERVAEEIARLKASSQMAAAINQATGGDTNEFAQATVNVALFRIQEAFAKGDIDPKQLVALTGSLNQVTRSMATTQEQVRLARLEGQREGRKEGSDRAAKKATELGMKPELVEIMRAYVEGDLPRQFWKNQN